METHFLNISKVFVAKSQEIWEIYLGDVDIFWTNCWNSEKKSSKFVNFGADFQKVENQTAKMRIVFQNDWRNSAAVVNAERCNSWVFNIFQLDSKGAKVRPEDACQERFSWFSDWSPKVHKKSVNPVRSRQEFSNEILANLASNRCRSKFVRN